MSAEEATSPIVSNTVTLPIDLKPPQEWLDNFPLSRQEIKDLNKSFEGALRLPQTLDEFQKELSFDKSSLEMFQDDIEPLVKLYIQFCSHAEDYRNQIFPSIVSIPRSLRSHCTIVVSYYGALYSAIDDFKDEDADHDWASRIVDHVSHRVVSQMDRISHVAETVVEKLVTLKNRIDSDSMVVQEHISRLKKKKRDGCLSGELLGTGDTGKRSSQKTESGKALAQPPGNVPLKVNHQDEESSLEVIQLQYDLFGDALREIVGKIVQTIAIVDAMRDKFKIISGNFNTIRARTTEETSGSIPGNLLAPDLPEEVFGKWEELSIVISGLPTS
jgi:hypothetical protein